MKIAFKNFLTTLKRYKVASLLNIAGLMIYVCIERINEIMRGEEDDISKY